MPVVLLLFFCLSVGTVVLSQEDTGEGEGPPPGDVEEQLIELLQNIRTVYMDMYPLYEKLKLMRQSGTVSKTERRNIKEKIQDRVEKAIDSMSRRFETLKTGAGNQRIQRRIRKAEKEIFDPFVLFVRRFLKDWSPEHPNRVRRMSMNEKIENGVAGPDLLRRYVLTRLERNLLAWSNNEYDVENRIDRVKEGIQALYWDVLSTYARLVQEVERAREKAEKKKTETKGDNGENEEESEGRSSKGNEEESKEKIRKEYRRAIRKAEREWQQFVEKSRSDIDEKERQIKRIWSLYAGREYLQTREKKTMKKARSLMRKMGRIKKMLNRDQVFSKETVDDIMTRHADLILVSGTEFLKGESWPSESYSRMEDRKELDDLKEEGYQDTLRRLMQGYTLLKKASYDDLEQQTRLISQNLGPIATYLQKLEDEDKKETGKLLSELQEIARQAYDRLRKDLRARDLYFETFRKMNFKNAKSFKKRFSKRMEKLQKQIYGSNEENPQPTGSTLRNRLNELRKKVRREGISIE